MKMFQLAFLNTRCFLSYKQKKTQKDQLTTVYYKHTPHKIYSLKGKDEKKKKVCNVFKKSESSWGPALGSTTRLCTSRANGSLTNLEKKTIAFHKRGMVDTQDSYLKHFQQYFH